jgi:hypothetical protein
VGQFVTGPIAPGYLLSRCRRCKKPTDRHDNVTCAYSSDGSTLFRTTGEIVYIDNDDNERITPGDLLSDGSSNPPLTWPLIGHPFRSTRLKSSLWHDGQYQCAPPCDATLWAAIRSEARREVDGVYLEMMDVEGDDDREKVYRGVRWGGWWAWYRHAKNNAKLERG